MSSRLLPRALNLAIVLVCGWWSLCWAQGTGTDPSKNKSNANTASCHPYSLRIPPEAIEKKYRRSSTPALVIAHRGASYHLPEHTLEAYRLALELGADFIEPDLVVTQDGVLIALHTVDLNVTTNVEQVFGETVQPWYSETVGRAGYWTFNFTWDEIQQLTVRQRLPAARSTAFDGLFRVPSLEQILQTLHQWNFYDLPARLGAVESSSSTAGGTESTEQQPTPLQKYRSGLYAEFKEANWILQDSGMDLVELLFDSIAKALDADEEELNGEYSASSITTSSAYYWRDLLPCFETVRHDEYLVPGLVLQSFDAHDLQRFHEQWNNLSPMAPEPPYILLTDHSTCWTEELWFNIGEQWRSFLAGIGCDKICLLGDGSTESDKRAAAAFVDKAEEFDLVLHPWTERPEREFVVTETAFASSDDELHYLLCGTSDNSNISNTNWRGVQGVFTESVDAVLRVRCDDNDNAKTSTTASATASGNDRVDPNAAATTAFIGISALVVGIVGTLLVIRLGRHHPHKAISHKLDQSGVRVTRIPQFDNDEESVASRNSTSDLQLA